jgi:hypothetical protein
MELSSAMERIGLELLVERIVPRHCSHLVETRDCQDSLVRRKTTTQVHNLVELGHCT